MAQHHVQVLVSRARFFKNIQQLRRLVAPAKLCVVMKANAYGHGLEALCPVAVEAGADMLGICTNPEAETIRRLGLKIPLLRLRMALEAEMEESLREFDVQEQVGSREAAAYLAAAGVQRGRPVDVHLDIDTGMGRSGFFPDQRRAMVRVGAACYGVRTSREFENPAELKPVMSFRTWVGQVRDVPKGHTVGYGGLFTTARDSRIASLPVGFGEGYPRALFNKGIVLIHGKRCPVIGRVSLNVLTIDVTDLESEVLAGDEVVLIGSQGDQEVTFEEMADRCSSVHTEINLMAGSLNTISYA